MIQLHQVDLKKEQLDRIPGPERRLFVLVGHAANELNALAKLFHFAASSASETGLAGQAENAQALVLARVLTGKIYEFWQLLQTSFFAVQLSREYEPQMESEARAALNELKRYFGRDNLISAVRNKFAFHYSSDQVDAGYMALLEGDPLQVYLAKENANTLYAFADTISGRAMLEAIQPGDHKAAFDALITQTTKAVQDIGVVIAGIMVVCLKKHIGTSFYELGAKIIEIEGVPESQTVAIPFFVEIPDAKDENT